MSSAVRLTLFAVLVGATFVGGAALGGTVGPIGSGRGGAGNPGPPDTHELHRAASEASGGSAETASTDGSDSPHGGAGSQSGYRVEFERTTLDAAVVLPLRFRVRGPEGEVVQQYELRHERELHLVLVGHDLRSYLHLHPTREADGTWSVSPPPLAPGTYRAYADFVVADGPRLALVSDLLVPGNAVLAATAPAGPTAFVDGYEIRMAATPPGPVVASGPADLTFSVLRDGGPITDLESHLGAKGHLVVIRSADLGYIHAHPVDDDRPSTTQAVPEVVDSAVRFRFEPTAPGDHRLFLEFAHGGTVHRVDFALSVVAP